MAYPPRKQQTTSGRSGSRSLAPLVLLTLGGWFPLGDLEAAVVVVCNRSEEPVEFALEPVWGQGKQYSLGPGEMVRVQVSDSVELTRTQDDKEIQHSLAPNSVHNFVAKKGKPTALEQVTFSNSRGSGWLFTPSEKQPPGVVTVPVKILADEEQLAAMADWRTVLGDRLAAASESIEAHSGVRFRVADHQTWESDDDQTDFRRLEAQFRQTVATDPARLAIGLTGQFQISEKTPLPHLTRRPFLTHLLLPAIQEGFTETDQLELLVHELGHFLGAVHSPEENSVMRSPIPQPPGRGKEAKKQWDGPSGTSFDAINTLAISLIADELRTRPLRHPSELPRRTRWRLGAIYGEMARRVRSDSQAARSTELFRDTAFSGWRYTGRWVDGTRRDGDEVAPWHETESNPALSGRRLFEGEHPIRWLRDNTLPPADRPQAVVELVGGDRLPGRVVGIPDGDRTANHQLPPYLLVTPYVQLNWPRGPARPQVRVTLDWVRRIVWKPITDRYQPQTLFLFDGRQLDFRSARLAETSVRLLREEGIREVPLSDVAELHFPQHDPWEAYFDQLAILSPDGAGRLVELETADGLRATGSTQRFQAHAYGSEEDPDRWHHLVQTAWSPDPFWVLHRAIRLRRYFLPQEVPLSRIDPVAVREQSDLGSAWRWRRDRNTEGGPLESGGLAYPWGFGVHAANELEFPLPDCVRAFRTQLGLDALAGEGGSVEAKIFAGSTGGKPLFGSGLMVGSADVMDTGRLSVNVSPSKPGRLILAVDAAHNRRPAGADPFDLCDRFDWLEPLIDLDPTQLRAEILHRAPQRIPAWRGWDVTTGTAEAARLVNHWDTTDSQEPTYRLLAVSDETPLKLSRQLRVGPNANRLLLAVSRPPETSAVKIEVHVDGESVDEFEVPVRSSRQAPDPHVVPLPDEPGRRLTVEVIQKSPTDGENEQPALVEWRALTLVGPPVEAPQEQASGE